MNYGKVAFNRKKALWTLLVIRTWLCGLSGCLGV